MERKESLFDSLATVHKDVNAGKLRCILFGSARRVRLEDHEEYVQARSASGLPTGEDWCTVAAAMRATGP